MGGMEYSRRFEIASTQVISEGTSCQRTFLGCRARPVQAALDQFVELGRSTFLERYEFGRSRDYLVRDPRSGKLCDSTAIVGDGYGFQFLEEGPLKPEDFSGGEAAVVLKLRNLGFEVVRIGEDWSADEVEASVTSYFDMLRPASFCLSFRQLHNLGQQLVRPLSSKNQAGVGPICEQRQGEFAVARMREMLNWRRPNMALKG